MALPDERQQVLKILDEIVVILGQVVDSRWILFNNRYYSSFDNFNELYDEEDTRGTRVIMREAWIEVKNQFDDKRSEVGNAILSGHKDYDLEMAGFTGKQLEIKERGFWGAVKNLRRKGGIKALKKVFEWSNKFLSSFNRWSLDLNF